MRRRNALESASAPTAKTWIFAVAVAAYVGAVLLVDTLAAMGVRWPIPWRLFRVTTSALPGFDVYKFVFWFLLPFLACVWRMDWGYFGVGRWQRRDWLLLAGFAAVCVVAVAVIPLFPSLRQTYMGSVGDTRQFLAHHAAWLASWLPGWEFLHKYVLLRALMAVMPRYGWLGVPLSEGLYHAQKPWPEMLGMFAFSLALTYWAQKRKNLLLPFLAHLAVEVELVIFLLVASR